MKQLVIRARLNGNVIGLGSSYILYHKQNNGRFTESAYVHHDNGFTRIWKEQGISYNRVSAMLKHWKKSEAVNVSIYFKEL